jgi:NAD(P)-dependent dehydrogenase (short-subunit alcohol dehydrogenase family)
MSSTQKPVAIVTGASSGIGLGITLALGYAANNIRSNTVSPGTIKHGDARQG